MKIGGVQIGSSHQTYVIAEIGGNHDGSLARAFELIRAAANAGADCAKFQLYRSHKLYPGRDTPGAIPDEWLPELKAACHEDGIEFMCSVFCEETLDAYLLVQPAAVKIASPEALNSPLLRAAAVTGLPLIVSTGAMTKEQVTAMVWETRRRYCGLALLHCVSTYPVRDYAELNLNAIGVLAREWRIPVGFSDHTEDEITVPQLAVAAGACILEKHLTYDRNADGPDHGFALEPGDFEVMVTVIRQAEDMLGDGVKRVMASEDPTDRRQAA